MSINSLNELYSFIKSESFDVIVKEFSKVKFLLRTTLKEFIGKNIHELNEVLPLKECNLRLVVSTHENLKIYRISLIKGLLDLLIFVDPKSNNILGFDQMYSSSDKEHFNIVPIGYNPVELLA